MTKTYQFLLSVLFAFCLLQNVVAQTKEDIQSQTLDQLLEEREILIQDYKYYNSQNSNFWGKKSKKDLMNIIETLKKIINKDSEIVVAVRSETIKKKASQEVQQEIETITEKGNIQMYKDRLHDMNRQLASLQNLNKNRSKEIVDLKDRLKEAQQEKYSHDRTATLFGIVAGIMLLYIIVLHVKLSKTKPKKARRKKK